MEKKELEIEFKNELKKDEYINLINIFKNSNCKTIVQTNYYFDTNDFNFVNNKTTIRLREINNLFELQIKKKIKDFTCEEIITKIDSKKALNMINEGFIYNNFKLNYITKLKTTRTTINYNSYLICLDLNEFIDNSIDYEIEIECNDLKKGNDFFNNFLKNNNIKRKKIRGKRYRAFNKLTI